MAPSFLKFCRQIQQNVILSKSPVEVKPQSLADSDRTFRMTARYRSSSDSVTP